jgi:hypothetical protein
MKEFHSVNISEKLTVGRLMHLLLERVWAIMGMDNFLVGLITHPEEAHRFPHMIASYARGVFDRYRSA